VIQSEALHALLAPLVGGRCFPVMFPQEPLPTWPAIRYTPIGGTVWAANCGSDGGETDDPTVQIDCVAESYMAARALHQSVRTALLAFDPPAVADGALRFDYDAETRTHRASQDYTLYPSTPSA
jgi:hypothetical protein